MSPKDAVRKIREYTVAEHRVDAFIHIAGIVFAINASAWLLAHIAGAASLVASVTVYCVGLVAMIGMSAAYNLTPHHHPSKLVLRRLDHAAIFIMIAATYTPFAVNRLGHPDGIAILVAIWASATVGVVLKLLFPHRFERISLALYLGMGWLIVTALKPLFANVAAIDLWLLLGGGLVYSAGVAFYVIERIPFHKAIWHAFVLAAAILQFAAIAGEFSVIAHG
jgi:hemolysin III